MRMRKTKPAKGCESCSMPWVNGKQGPKFEAYLFLGNMSVRVESKSRFNGTGARSWPRSWVARVDCSHVPNQAPFDRVHFTTLQIPGIAGFEFISRLKCMENVERVLNQTCFIASLILAGRPCRR